MSDAVLSAIYQAPIPRVPSAKLPAGAPAGTGGAAGAGSGSGADEEGRLRAAAVRFEAAFLAEMLRHAGLAKPRPTFGGGAGEQAFAGSLVQEYASRIADSGGVGLADSIYRSLRARDAR